MSRVSQPEHGSTGPRASGGVRPASLPVPCPRDQEDERWGDASNDEDDAKERALPEDPETCLQLNMVYQEVVREKLAEVSLLLAQNREQQVGPASAPVSAGSRCCLAHGWSLCPAGGGLVGPGGVRRPQGEGRPEPARAPVRGALHEALLQGQGHRGGEWPGRWPSDARLRPCGRGFCPHALLRVS